MSVKQVWNGIIARVYNGLNYKYNKDTGAYENVSARVFLIVKVQEGRDAGRLVRVMMTPEEAERQATALIEAARKTRESAIG